MIRCYQIHRHDGGELIVHAGAYRHEDGKYIFECAQVWPVTPGRPPYSGKKPEVMSHVAFADSEIEEIQEIIIPPPVAEPVIMPDEQPSA
jgi:hypothetical protein